MTLTGGNADKRVIVKPSEQSGLIQKLYAAIVEGKSIDGSNPADEALKKALAQINKAGSNAVVLTGVKDENAQLLCLAINKALASKAFDPVNYKNTRQGNSERVKSLINEMNEGKVEALIISGVNPVYAHPQGNEFGEALKKVSLSIGFAMSLDQTAELCQYTVAAPHYLESLGGF